MTCSLRERKKKHRFAHPIVIFHMTMLLKHNDNFASCTFFSRFGFPEWKNERNFNTYLTLHFFVPVAIYKFVFTTTRTLIYPLSI